MKLVRQNITVLHLLAIRWRRIKTFGLKVKLNR